MYIEELKKVDFFNSVENLNTRIDGLTKTVIKDTMIEYINYLISKDIEFSLLLLDIDNFKYINDNFGHLVGDEVLEQVGKVIVNSIKEVGVCGRFGGDEFIIVIPHMTEYGECWQTLKELRANIAGEIYDSIEKLSITATIGLSRCKLDGNDYDTLLEKADKALYRGKTKGRNCFIIYLKDKHENIDTNNENGKEINQMDLHFQIFNRLTKDRDVKKNVTSLLKYLTTYMMIDHLCIQSKSSLYFNTIYELSSNIDYEPLNEKHIKKNIGNRGFTHINKANLLKRVNQEEFFMELKKQKIEAIVLVNIEAFGKKFGTLRADMNHGRIWQEEDISLLITAARVLAMVLYYEDLTIEKL